MDTELVARLRAVIGKLARVLNDTSTGEDLTPTQYSVLALVRSRGPIGLTELADLEGLNPTMLSRVVKVLDERGLVRRMADPGDARAARLAATADGEQVHDRVRASRTKVLTETLGELPPETVDALLAAVPSLEALGEALKPAHPAHPAHKASAKQGA
jgi:DNA-binding MarR family transcriptional regulator